MRVYVILYRDLWLKTCKVSQEGFKNLSEAQKFCLERVGDNGVKHSEYKFQTLVTQELYEIVEVII